MKKFLFITILFFILCLNLNAAENRSCLQLFTSLIDKKEVFNCNCKNWTGEWECEKREECRAIETYLNNYIVEDNFNYALEDFAQCVYDNNCNTMCSNLIGWCNSNSSVGLDCLYDDQIKYDLVDNWNYVPDLYARKNLGSTCEKTTLDGYYSDIACYYNSMGCPASGYSTGRKKYYNYKRRIVTKKAPSTPPKGYVSCWSKSYNIPYSINTYIKYPYNCSDLTFGCVTTSGFVNNYVKGTSLCSLGNEYSNMFSIDKNSKVEDIIIKNGVKWGRVSSSPVYKCTVSRPVTKYEESSLDMGLRNNMLKFNKVAYCLNTNGYCDTSYYEASYFQYVQDMKFSCSSSCNSSLNCGLIGILKYGNSKGISYDAIYLALHMWSTYKGRRIKVIGSHPDLGKTLLSNLYYNTVNRVVNSGYKGSFNDTVYVDGIMYQKNTSMLSDAINLFNKCFSNKIGAANSSSSSAKVVSNIVDFSQLDIATIKFKTTFNNNTKIDIDISNGVEVEGNLIRENKDGYHYITINLKDVAKLCSKNKKNFVITLSASGSGAIKVLQYVRKFYRFSNSDLFFITYYPMTVNSYSKKFTINVKCPDCDNTELETTNTLVNGSTNCEDKRTVSFEDPSMDKIIKACDEQREPYKYDVINQYCDLYCTEKIDMELMPIVTGKAGRFFKYDLSGRVKKENVMTALSTSTMQCVSEINYNQWKSDYNAASASAKTQLLIDIKECNLYENSGAQTSMYNKIINDYKNKYKSVMDVTYQETGLENTPKIDYETETVSSTNTKWCINCKNVSEFKTPSSTEVIGGVTVPTNTRALMSTTINVDYYQSQDYYTQSYTGKISLIPQPNYEKLEDYIYPLNLKTKSGLYDITIDYSNIGGFERNVNNTGKYICKYQVENDIIPDSDGDVGLLFRQIDLLNIFPGGREVGSNWKNAENIIKDIQELGNDVWLETPKYSFTLNPANISKIRGYNNDKEDLKAGYLDASIICESGFKKCRSSFLNSISDYTAAYELYPGRND